jgi:hypothetical protein
MYGFYRLTLVPSYEQSNQDPKNSTSTTASGYKEKSMYSTSRVILKGGFVLSEVLSLDKRKIALIEVSHSDFLKPVSASVQAAHPTEHYDDDTVWATQFSEKLECELRSCQSQSYLLLCVSTNGLVTILTAGSLRAHHIDKNSRRILNSNHEHPIQRYPDMDLLMEHYTKNNGLDPSFNIERPALITEQWKMIQDRSLIFICSDQFHNLRDPSEYVTQAINFNMDRVFGFEWVLCFQLQVHSIPDE